MKSGTTWGESTQRLKKKLASHVAWSERKKNVGGGQIKEKEKAQDTKRRLAFIEIKSPSQGWEEG